MDRLVNFCSMINELNSIGNSERDYIPSIFNKYGFKGEYDIDLNYGDDIVKFPVKLSNELEKFIIMTGIIDEGYRVQNSNYHYSMKYNKIIFHRKVVN